LGNKALTEIPTIMRGFAEVSIRSTSFFFFRTHFFFVLSFC
jgi:hypothetical protein